MESFTSISTQKVTDLTRFSLSVQRFNAFKHHWSDNRVPVLLEVNQGSVDQIDPATNRVLCSYDYKDMEGITHVRQTQLVLSSTRFKLKSNLELCILNYCKTRKYGTYKFSAFGATAFKR